MSDRDERSAGPNPHQEAYASQHGRIYQAHGDQHFHGSEKQSRTGRWLLLAVTAVVVIVALTITLVSIDRGSSSRQNPSLPSLTATSGALANDASQLDVTTVWPQGRGCDGATSVAMPAGGPDITSFLPALNSGGGDVRSTIVNAGGASWTEGHLTLGLTGRTASPVQILNLRPRIDPISLPNPAWVYQPEGGCGDSAARVFRWDLDRDTFTDSGIQGGEYTPKPAPPSESLGPAFTVTATDSSFVVIDTISCHRNYQWHLDITYGYHGREFTRTLGPFRSMGGSSTAIADYTDDGTSGRRNFVASGAVSRSADRWPCTQT